jgi:hypothetical protein
MRLLCGRAGIRTMVLTRIWVDGGCWMRPPSLPPSGERAASASETLSADSSWISRN